MVELFGQWDGELGLPVVVLLGSLGTTLDVWEPQLAALTRTHRVLRLDTRGHGRSPVVRGPCTIEELPADVLMTLDREAVATASFVGCSLGAMIAMRIAVDQPQRVDRLAVLCTSARLADPRLWLERAATVRAEGPGALADAVMARWFSPAADPELVARHRGMVASTPAEGYSACCEALSILDLLDDLPRISAPTLAVAGELDPSTPPAHLREIACRIPGARLVELPGARHLVHVERPDEVNRLLVQHLGAHSG